MFIIIDCVVMVNVRVFFFMEITLTLILSSTVFLLQGGVGAQCSRRDGGGTRFGELHGPAASLWG